MFRSVLSRRVAFAPIAAAFLVAACATDPQRAADGFIASGNDYMKAEKYPEAIIQFRSAIGAGSSGPEARLQLARAYAANNEFKAAFLEYRRVGDILPDDIQVQSEVGNMLLLGRFFDEARERARRILLKDPENLSGLILLGNALAGLNDLENAVSVAERAVRAAPEREGAYTNLGVFQLARGNRKEAEAAFQKAVELNPKSVSALLALANFYQTIGELDKAEGAFKRALSLEPNNFRANRGLAALYVNTNLPSRAAPYLLHLAESANTTDVWFDYADYLVSQGKHEEALKALDRLPADPTNVRRAKARRAEVLHSLGRTAEAHGLVTNLLAENAEDGEALALSARFLLQERRPEQALARAQSAVQADPNSVPAHYILGKIFLVRGELEAARRAFGDALKLNPGALDAQIEISRLHLTRNEIDTAIQTALDAVRLHPRTVDAKLALVRALLARPEDHPKALAQVTALVQEFPASPAAVSAVGHYHLAVKNLAAARREFEQALKLDPGHLDAILQLVALDMSAGRPNDAKRRLNARLAARPNDPTVLLTGAKVALAQRQMAEAERILRHLTQVDPSNVDAYTLLGQLYISQKKYAEAVIQFAAIAERDSKSATAHTMLGLLRHAQRRPREAIEHYQRAFEADPQSAAAANNLAWILAENDIDLERALLLARSANASLPANAKLLDTLGWVYVKREMYPLAATALEEAVQLDRTDPLLPYHLGVAYAKMGDDAKARKALEKALKLKPDFAQAEDAKKILKSLVY